jgi:NosR/NirI family nitrous oxide reductase transcriptional regulator
MVLYYDSHTCPPLVYERKAREKAGLPLTPINARGYFQPVSGSAPLPVDTMAPSGQAGTRWTDELWFHLFPWSVRVGQDLLVIRVIAAALLVVVTGAWGLLAAQRVAPVIVLVWWLGWSVYEVLTRLHYKPVVKEGVWWGHQYRAASLGDMIAYVTTKNLLVAALLFVVLAALGRLDLPAMPGMPWSAG